MSNNNNNIANNIIIILLIIIAVKLGVDFSRMWRVAGGFGGLMLIFWLFSLLPDGFFGKIFDFLGDCSMSELIYIFALLAILRELMKRIGSLIFGY